MTREGHFGQAFGGFRGGGVGDTVASFLMLKANTDVAPRCLGTQQCMKKVGFSFGGLQVYTLGLTRNRKNTETTTPIGRIKFEVNWNARAAGFPSTTQGGKPKSAYVRLRWQQKITRRYHTQDMRKCVRRPWKTNKNEPGATPKNTARLHLPSSVIMVVRASPFNTQGPLVSLSFVSTVVWSCAEGGSGGRYAVASLVAMYANYIPGFLSFFRGAFAIILLDIATIQQYTTRYSSTLPGTWFGGFVDQRSPLCCGIVGIVHKRLFSFASTASSVEEVQQYTSVLYTWSYLC